MTRMLSSTKFVLVGHSMGGFSFFERVAHLIFADLWGFPPEEDNLPLWMRPIKFLAGLFNPMMASRLSGRLGRFLLRRGFGYLAEKFIGAVDDPYENISQYLQCCNSQSPTGETCMTQTIMARGGYQCAKYPMVNRLQALEPDTPITFIYGASSWIVREPGRILMERMIGVNVHVIGGTGHHVYADTKDQFNEVVLIACEKTDTAGVGHRSSPTTRAP